MTIPKGRNEWQAERCPTARDVHVLIPRTCKYVRVHGREGKTVAGGIQVATQLTLK